MEDDNALDIVKWLFKEETIPNLSGTLTLHRGEQTSKWNARLKGNLLGMRPVDEVVEPMLLVCENIRVERVADQEFFLAICSHMKTQAELDQLLHEFSVANTTSADEGYNRNPESPLSHFFLTSPFKKEHTFSVFHSYNVPNRKVVCEETMYESKLSMVLPIELARTFRRSSIALRDVLREKYCNMRNTALMEATLHVMRHLNSNIEIYTQMIEFLDDYVGPYFRPSGLAFSVVPVNLHVQTLQIGPDASWYFVTCGAISAAPLRYRAGGLSRIRDTLNASLEANAQNHTMETRFYTRRKTLENASSLIDNLTRRINNDWHIGEFGTVDKVGLQLFSEVKQLHELLVDLIQSFPNVHNLVDALCPGGNAQLAKPLICETLSSQLDSLEAAIISLNTKMAVIDKVQENKVNPIRYNGMPDSWGLIVALRKAPDAQMYFQLQLRYDIVLSQAITLIATCLLTNVESSTKEQLLLWEKVGPFVSFFGFLSCYSDERGMIEDMREIWSVFYGRVSKNCIPGVSGHPTSIDISIPITEEALAKLPKAYAEGEWFRVRTVYWNLGVNHEASLAASVGDISLEESINLAALTVTSNFVQAAPDVCNETVKNLLDELKKTVEESPSRKNLNIFHKVQALTRALNGTCVVSCKSGKDRTPFQIHFLPKEFRPPSGTFTHNVSS
ncbi:Type I inositol 3,4-bisphosphate 4-phosphatase [Aphelenchoides fujianensis]|nr:Type I inositol 3,4-bisphosphate 4-phosphatase [Aphelenchoides fujianensis]